MPTVARHRQYKWRWVSAAFATIGMLVVGAATASCPEHERAAWLLAGSLPVLFAAASISQFSRLEFDEQKFTVVDLWRTRSIDLSRLSGVGYRASGKTASCLLATADKRFKLSLDTYDRDDAWKPLILQSADQLGVPVAGKARQSLSHADGTGRCWFA